VLDKLPHRTALGTDCLYFYILLNLLSTESCMNVRTYIHVRTCIHTHTYIHTYIHIRTYIHTCTYIHTRERGLSFIIYSKSNIILQFVYIYIYNCSSGLSMVLGRRSL